MKRFCYVCEFVHKDAEDPKKVDSVERHVFVFVFRKKKKGKDAAKNRLAQWWNSSDLFNGPESSEPEPSVPDAELPEAESSEKDLDLEREE